MGSRHYQFYSLIFVAKVNILYFYWLQTWFYMTQNAYDGLNNQFNYHNILVAEIIILDLVNNNFDYPVSNLGMSSRSKICIISSNYIFKNDACICCCICLIQCTWILNFFRPVFVMSKELSIWACVNTIFKALFWKKRPESCEISNNYLLM